MTQTPHALEQRVREGNEREESRLLTVVCNAAIRGELDPSSEWYGLPPEAILSRWEWQA